MKGIVLGIMALSLCFLWALQPAHADMIPHIPVPVPQKEGSGITENLPVYEMAWGTVAVTSSLSLLALYIIRQRKSNGK